MIGNLFQFHKGTIRTNSSVSTLRWSFLFQFHKGTIRTLQRGNMRKNDFLFQFHKGTIRTHVQLGKLPTDEKQISIP